ncbi:hypothetical protein D3C78_1702080 [compost metagenome]
MADGAPMKACQVHARGQLQVGAGVELFVFDVYLMPKKLVEKVQTAVERMQFCDKRLLSFCQHGVMSLEP